MSVRSLFITCLIGFACAVTLSWFQVHFGHGYPWIKKMLPTLLLGGTSVAVLLFQYSWKQKSLPLWQGAFLIFLLAILHFNLSRVILPLFLDIDSLPIHQISESNLFLIRSLTAIVSLFAILTSTFLLLGSTLKGIRRRKDLRPSTYAPEDFVSSLMLGLTASIWILVLLDWLQATTQTLLIGLILALHLWRFRTLIDLIKVLGHRLTLPPPRSLGFISIAFLFTLSAIILGETVRPAPTGYDDSTFYYDHIRNKADGTFYPQVAYPTPYETLAAALSIGTHESNQMFALSLGIYGLFLSLVFFYGLNRRLFGLSRNDTIFGTALFLSIPMGLALSLFETKPDALMLPSFLAGFWFLGLYWKTEKRSSLFLSAFILGSAAAFKLTALFFLPGYLIVILVTGFKFRRSLWHTSRRSLCFLALATLPLLPWLATRYVLPKPTDQATIRQKIEAITQPLACHPTGSVEDYARFDLIQHPSVSTLITFPWRLTMNTQVNAFATEIGLSFLALLPFTLFLFRRHAAQNSTSFTFLIGPVIASGLILWLLYGRQVLWYAWPLFPLLMCVLLIMRQELGKLHPTLTIFITSILGLSLIGNTLIELKFTDLESHFRFIVGTHATEDYLEKAQFGYQTIMRRLNQDPSAKVWVTNTRVWYGIEQSSERAFMDYYLDTFACLTREYSPAQVASLFRSLNIRYLLWSRSLNNELDNHPDSTYSHKIRSLADFTAHYLRPVWGSQHHILFEFVY